MHQERVFNADVHFRAGKDEPPRIVITQSADSVVVCWHVEPGQRIELHSHPTGQDTWIILGGQGTYFTGAAQETAQLAPGFVAVARRGQIHGAINTGPVPLRFISVVAPAESGFEPVASPAAPEA